MVAAWRYGALPSGWRTSAASKYFDESVFASGRNFPYGNDECIVSTDAMSHKPHLTMNPLHPIFAAVALAAVVTTAYGITKILGPTGAQGRFSTIDGLRGYLAFFVFLHHSAIWYFYVRTGRWEVPPSNLYTHFGQTSVLLFFMITGFLFYTKLLDSKHRGVDWVHFFVSRILRLLPLYLVAMVFLFLIVGYQSGAILREPVTAVVVSVIKWLLFTILGAPSINQIDAGLIMARVTWSLPYEWYFYLALPVLALSARIVAPIPFLLIGGAGIAVAATRGLSIYYLMGFFGGIAAALAVRYEAFCRVSASSVSSCAVIACLVAVLAFFPGANGISQIIILSIAFALIAGGGSLFGALVSQTSRTLGQMAYSIYLLHGILLFIIINYVVGAETLSNMTPVMFWILISSITPVLVGICLCTFKFVEAPAMQFVPTVMAWLRRPSNAAPAGAGARPAEK